MTQGMHHAMLDEGESVPWSPRVGQEVAETARTAEAGAELVRRARDGDARAFDDLARDRIDAAFRLAVAIMRSEVEAADVVQDAFVSAWRNLPSLRDPARFDPWLDRIVVNACRMALRRRRGLQVREILVAEPVDHSSRLADPTEPGPEERLADRELVRRALLRLDADKRAILVLHHVQDRPVEEIAAVIGIPVGTVKWRLHAARTELQRILQEVAR